MTVAFWCLIVAGVLPLSATATAKWGFEAYDNNSPRDWLAKQTGSRARAAAAEKNCHESFPFFAAAVLIAHLSAGPSAIVNALALIYVVARIAYIAAYVKDWASARTLVFMVGYLAILAIATAGAWSPSI